MQKQQVFKVKGMQRDASMANANGEFAYEILNMRLMPAEDLSGFSLTNEKGALATGITLDGQVIGQCPTHDSLIVFTVDNSISYIYKIYQNQESWERDILYSGDLNFDENYPIEALFNYETEDIQKVYWIDGINQLRCINIATPVSERNNWNNQSFDSVKEINSIPSVEIKRVAGGSFTAGVIQYYVTYFNKSSSESPIVYTSPLLYIAHDNRGANVNDQVSTAFKLTFTDLDTTNWEYMRIYVTHRTSIDATPEASIVTELNMNNSTIESIDYGSNRTSIAPTDLYFTGGKFVKAGTMTVKDQVMFLGNLNIETSETVSVVEIQHLFDSIRDNEDHPFTTTTRKTKENKLEEYEDTHYYYKNQLNNTESITHYKYGEKYRFGISVLDKYGNWSNPIWIKDAFIEVPPEQVDRNTLELPCPSLNLSYRLTYNSETKTLLEHLQDRGAIDIKPVVVFPKEDERKVIAQGVVCPTVYNLKDRKENGPYAQASWFMRPNAPVDLWNLNNTEYTWLDTDNRTSIKHASDVIYPGSTTGYNIFDKSSIKNSYISQFNVTNWKDSVMSLVYDDVSLQYIYNGGNMGGASTSGSFSPYNNYAAIKTSYGPFPIYTGQLNFDTTEGAYGININGEPNVFYTSTFDGIAKDIVTSGSWLEFRHNYSIRTVGWSWGPTNDWHAWSFGNEDREEWSTDEYPIKNISTDISDNTATVIIQALDNTAVNGTYPKDTNGIVQAGSLWTDKNYGRIFFYKFRLGSNRCAELEASRFGVTIPVNRFIDADSTNAIQKSTWRNISLDKYNTGNSAFYVDNSIVTLNSPEFEFSNTEHGKLFRNSDFRIIGLVPLTATISDISTFTTGSNYNPSSDSSAVLGERKVIISNKNIGHHGYKGLVAASLYSSFHNSPHTLEYEYNESTGNQEGLTDDPAYPEWYYANFSLYPWQNTGSLVGFSPSANERNTYSILKNKRLSNLRFSASSYFFGINNLAIDERLSNFEINNQATITTNFSKIVGWKPYNGSQIMVWNSDTSSILRFEGLGYPVNPVYSANIDSIALVTAGENNTIPLNTYKFFYGRKLLPSKSLGTNGFSKYIGGAMFDDVYTSGIGSSIKYKSSPHAVIAFNTLPLTIDGKSMWAQEITPYMKSNPVGLRYNSRPGVLSDNCLSNLTLLEAGELYENNSFISIPHQSNISVLNKNHFGLSEDFNSISTSTKSDINYGWLWLGEIYRETDPTFGGTSDYALQNNQWENGGSSTILSEYRLDDDHYYTTYCNGGTTWYDGNNIFDLDYWEVENDSGEITITDNIQGNQYRIYDKKQVLKIALFLKTSEAEELTLTIPTTIVDSDAEMGGTYNGYYTIIKNILDDGEVESFNIKAEFPENGIGIETIELEDLSLEIVKIVKYDSIKWTQGDTYYQRFDTLKTYAYSDSDQNSVIDITSFMVETRINIDGRYDRNRGQESNLQMSPTNFNLMNDVYSQRDNFFTYRILDEDMQARTNFPNQITWSLTKTAGATVDAWMNITLANVLDLDGTKGELTALKNFNNNIIAFQEKGLSHIMFNSRAQIATSEAVPIQIANTGKVDGQQYLTTDVGCQDKWNIVTTPNGLYFVDYFNKSIYRFNGKLEDISTPNGFRSWCYENLDSTANIIGYYDVKNKEVMYYIGNTGFMLDNSTYPGWLGFSELTGAFSSFYTYPKAWFANVQYQGLWLLSENSTDVYTHQTGNYNELLNTDKSFYGLTVLPRQDSNIVKTFNNVEFRADSYDNSTLDDNNTFDTISAETEYQVRTEKTLTYDKYKPSNLKKKFRTWRANIPRVNNGYNRFVNQWAKIGLWKMNPSTEKTILHDLSVWYSE